MRRFDLARAARLLVPRRAAPPSPTNKSNSFTRFRVMHFNSARGIRCLSYASGSEILQNSQFSAYFFEGTSSVGTSTPCSVNNS